MALWSGLLRIRELPVSTLGSACYPDRRFRGRPRSLGRMAGLPETRLWQPLSTSFLIHRSPMSLPLRAELLAA
jgi:hypothetical protein